MTPRRLIEPARLAGSRMLLGTQSDERLVDLARAGYAAAFEAIVERYRQPLLRYCLRFLPAARAEDAVQQAFANAYRSLTTSDAEVDLRPWLYRIAHNAALNQLRDRGLQTEELSEEIDSVERPDQAFERRERFKSVLTAVSGLPERQRDAILLREFEGRSYDEIAMTLGVGGGAVRQLLHRARAGVRSAATALTPYGLAERLLGDAGSRVAEATAGAGLGAVLTKASAAMLVTGAVVGSAAQVPRRHHHSGTQSSTPATREAIVASAPATPIAVRRISATTGKQQTNARHVSHRGSGDTGQHGSGRNGGSRGEDRNSGSDDRGGSGGSRGDRTLSQEPSDDHSGSGERSGSGDSTPEPEHTSGGSGTRGDGSNDAVEPLPSEPVTTVEDTSGHDGSGTSGSGTTSPDSTSGGHGSDDVSPR